MKKLKLRCAAFCALVSISLSAPSVLRLGTLKEISLPYVGNYRCEELRVGEIEFPTKGIRLELSKDGVATMYWKTVWGKEKSVACEYAYDEESNLLCAKVMIGKEEKNFKVPFKNGEILLSESLSGKAFYAKFSRK